MFPSHIIVTTLRPDIVVVLESAKQMVLLELTLPWKDHLKEDFERNLSKYQGLVSDCQQGSPRSRCLSVEVVCRCFEIHSLARTFNSLGIKGEERRKPSVVPPMQQRESQDGYWSKEKSHGIDSWPSGHNRGFDQLHLDNLEESVGFWKTQHTRLYQAHHWSCVPIHQSLIYVHNNNRSSWLSLHPIFHVTY